MPRVPFTRDKVPFTGQFHRTTLATIQELAEQANCSMARIMRELVKTGLATININDLLHSIQEGD